MKADLEIIESYIKNIKIKLGIVYDYTHRNAALSKELVEQVELALEAVIELEGYLSTKEDIADRLDDIEGNITTLFQEVARITEGKQL